MTKVDSRIVLRTVMSGLDRILKITLVPGTWAYGVFSSSDQHEKAKTPRWFEDGSEFRTKLEFELAQQHGLDFNIDILDWDCANSVRSRAFQAQRLAERLAGQRSSGVQRVVIAHSHGGNIACKAVAALEIETDDVKVVTLSTPFLQAQMRHEDSPKVILGILYVMLGFLCFGAFELVSGESRVIPGLKNYALGALILVPLLAAQLWYSTRADKTIADSINVRANPGVRFLAVRGYSDEASNAIVLGSIGTGLTNALLYVLAFPLRWFMGSKWRIAIAVLAAGLGLAGFTVKAVAIFKIVSIWHVIALLGVLLIGPVVIAGLFSSLFGRELFFESLNLIFTVDSVPDATCNVDVVTLTATQTSVKGLRHGIYAHPMCPRLVAYWLATGRTSVPPPSNSPNVQARPG